MTTSQLRSAIGILFSLAFLLIVSPSPLAQENPQTAPALPGPMLNEGVITLDTPEFTLVLVKSSQTASALKPKTAPDFDFTPGDLLIARSQDGYFHLGDIT